MYLLIRVNFFMFNILYYMNNIEILQDSIDTSISMNFYKTREEASKEHIFNSRLIKMELKKFKNVDNFNSERLKKSAVLAYPLNDRPRGDKDIKSVKFYQNLIKIKKVYHQYD